MSKMSQEEKKWRAESDARTLTRHAEIMADEERLTAAKEFIQKEAEKAKVALEAMNAYKKSGLI